MSHLLAQVSRLVRAEPPLPGADPILTTRGIKRAAERTLRIAESLARRLFCALALELVEEGQTSPPVPAKAGTHGVNSQPDDPWTPALILSASKDEAVCGEGSEPAKNRKHTFPLFEFVARIEDCISDTPPPERPERADSDRLPEDTPIPARSLIARTHALQAAIANHEAMARRLAARLQQGRHAGKLTNLAPGWPPGLPRSADPFVREQITWIGQTVGNWAVERHWAQMAAG